MVVVLALICLIGVSAILVRRHPLSAAGLSLGGSVLVEWAAIQHRTLVLVVIVALIAVEICFVAATQSRGVSVVAAVAVLGFPIASRLFPQEGQLHTMAELAAAVLVIVTAWLIGNSLRAAQLHAEQLRVRASEHAVTAERLRIARELHDVVAHSIGVIAIQAGVGRRVIDSQPGEARSALATIEATSRQTLAGLRHLLTALRESEAAEAPAGAGRRDTAGSGRAIGPLGPAPGLADISGLTQSTADAGVRVDVQWHGLPRSLPPDIDLSAFRIVQEALTNVVRHSGTDQCRVAIDCGERELSIEVIDGGRGGLAAASGYGIVGMRERAHLLGGQLSAGPRPGGGFRVAALLPLPVAGE